MPRSIFVSPFFVTFLSSKYIFSTTHQKLRPCQMDVPLRHLQLQKDKEISLTFREY